MMAALQHGEKIVTSCTIWWNQPYWNSWQADHLALNSPFSKDDVRAYACLSTPFRLLLVHLHGEKVQ